ncbi:MAG: right-handed parallel beta-helix repeat-containing protein [Planctomycetota bacterium]|jgi:parallel beta-helix repeat protein/predicted outer membrane repeat protein
MCKETKILGVFLVLALLGPASARVITVEVEGVVNYFGTGGGLALDGSVSIGSAMTGYCTYDTETPDEYPANGDVGVYPLISISMAIGNYTFTHDPTSTDYPSFCVYTVDPGYSAGTQAPQFDGTIYANGVPKTYDDINWGYRYLELFNFWTSSDEYIPTDALPDLDSWPELSVFDRRKAFETRFYGEGDDYFGIYGQITSLTVIPEPAKTYYVNATDGSDDNDGLSQETAFATIQKAIDSAFDGDTVIVADGTYTGPGNRDIDFLGKAITVRSESSPENCIIDCNGTEAEPHRGFYFHSSEDSNSVLQGFTIKNGYASGTGPQDCGGGIYCYISSPTITNCIISGNSAEDDGGGIYCSHSSPTINNCTINGNSTKWGVGGGIHCEESNPKISNCTIGSNSADSIGGGISCQLSSSPIINNCTITGNSAKYSGGGIACAESSSPIITNSTISGNSAKYSGGGIYCDYESNCTITKCTISGNTAKGIDGEYAYGGGIYCHGSDPAITNCTISGNSARMGGSIYFVASSPTIINSTITENTAESDGGGICCHSSNPTVTNCTFASNSGPNGSALACDSYQQQYPSNIQVINCILADGGNEIWNNDGSTITITYSDVQDGWEGEGNIDTDPLFVEPGYWEANGFWVEGDYHLLPDSSCIDAGDPNYIAAPNETDLDGNPRVNDGRIDMGAYETIIHEARLLILPRVLNRKSSKPRIMAWVRLPQGVTKDQIDRDEPLILYPGGITAMRQFVIQNRRRGSQHVNIIAFFDKAELMDAIPANGRAELQVLGHLRQPGQYFSGSDTVRIIARRSKPQPRRLHKLF